MPSLPPPGCCERKQNICFFFRGPPNRVGFYARRKGKTTTVVQMGVNPFAREKEKAMKILLARRASASPESFSVRPRFPFLGARSGGGREDLRDPRVRGGKGGRSVRSHWAGRSGGWLAGLLTSWQELSYSLKWPIFFPGSAEYARKITIERLKIENLDTE